MGEKLFLSGDEAIAQAALDGGVKFGTGYPGTPSTEILEHFSKLGGHAEWAPNEKVALEVGIGAAFGKVRAIVTMKHVGLNVAADPLFTIAYCGTDGGLVIVTADDPGMASSQNEQDNRRYAVAAGVPMLEPTDSQDAYDLTLQAFALSEQWRMPVLLRCTTRVCHSKGVVKRCDKPLSPTASDFTRDVESRVMIPAYARSAHRRLRRKLDDLQKWNEQSGPLVEIAGQDNQLGIIASGISYQHCRDAAPQAGFLKLEMTYPLPLQRMKDFAARYERCIVVEEGDPYLYEAALAAGIKVEGKDPMYRFGELNVNRIRRILARDRSPEAIPPRGKPPQLCVGCPHRKVFETLRDLGCIVSGDIGCYTLGVLPPFQAIDTCVCMGASIGVGLGLRHVLPEAKARKVVSVLGDSTFMHSGITGLVEMTYNRPATGHLVLILDNRTTAMTGLQENPLTGRLLDHTPTDPVNLEALVSSLGIQVETCDPTADPEHFANRIKECLAGSDLHVIVARRSCILAAAKAKSYQTKA